MSLGKRIKECRKKLKLTQKDLAAKMGGLDHTTISKWESDTYEPDANSLNKLAQAFGVTTDYLLGLTDDPTKETKKDSFEQINTLIKEYGLEQIGFFDIEQWKNLSPDDVKMVEEHFKMIVKLAKERNKENK